jgi:hypothetical protein
MIFRLANNRLEQTAEASLRPLCENRLCWKLGTRTVRLLKQEVTQHHDCGTECDEQISARENSMKNILELYHQYHAARNDERLELFDIVRAEYGAKSFLYPGCFVHITPAFVMPNATFVDTDKRARRFFDDPQTTSFVGASKQYEEEPELRFLVQDYTEELPIHRGYDLLISQYAGFVSESCKRHLRKGGVLLGNDSHGDASLASIDKDFRLTAVIQRRGEYFWISTTRLNEYFVPSKPVEVTRE